MELIFLGTGAGKPSRERNVTALILNLLTERQSLWLFDCGEGTQHQMLRGRIKNLKKLEKVFITHLHGDHIFGLPGLLNSRSMQGNSAPLTVYGPVGIKTYLETVLTLSDSRITYPLEIIEITAGELFTDATFTVSATLLDHRIETYGYRIVERNQPGRVIAIFGDTLPTPRALELADHADLIVHEATYETALADRAYQHGHSTTQDAAILAKESGAKRLIITHFSGRYSLTDSQRLLAECQSIFPATEMATDFATFTIK